MIVCAYRYRKQLLTTDNRARHLVSSGNEAGGVALFGGGGLLTSDKGLSWNSETGTLTVPRLQASEVLYSHDTAQHSTARKKKNRILAKTMGKKIILYAHISVFVYPDVVSWFPQYSVQLLSRVSLSYGYTV